MFTESIIRFSGDVDDLSRCSEANTPLVSEITLERKKNVGFTISQNQLEADSLSDS